MYQYGTHDATLQLYIIKGHAEILDPEKYQGLMVYTDADFARDLNSRISVSINIIEYIGTVIAWGVHKQTVPGTCTNITETKSIYKGVKKTLELRRFLESMNDSISGPILEKDRLTLRIRQLDIVLTWLHYQYIRGLFLPFYIDTKKKKGDLNTKPHGGETLVTMLLSIIGFKFYPPNTSKHYILLDLHKYNISVHRGSFLLPTKGPSPLLLSIRPISHLSPPNYKLYISLLLAPISFPVLPQTSSTHLTHHILSISCIYIYIYIYIFIFLYIFKLSHSL